MTEKRFVNRLKKKLSQIDIVLIKKDNDEHQTIAIQGKEIGIKWKPPISKLKNSSVIKILYDDCIEWGQKLIKSLKKDVDKKES